ncbi:g2858 [Coccomyxa elongata]
MDAPSATAATSAPIYAAKASQDDITPAKLPKVPSHDLSPPSVEGAEQKKMRTGHGPFSPPQGDDVGDTAEGSDW